MISWTFGLQLPRHARAEVQRGSEPSLLLPEVAGMAASVLSGEERPVSLLVSSRLPVILQSVMPSLLCIPMLLLKLLLLPLPLTPPPVVLFPLSPLLLPQLSLLLLLLLKCYYWDVIFYRNIIWVSHDWRKHSSGSNPGCYQLSDFDKLNIRFHVEPHTFCWLLACIYQWIHSSPTPR